MSSRLVHPPDDTEIVHPDYSSEIDKARSSRETLLSMLNKDKDYLSILQTLINYDEQTFTDSLEHYKEKPF